MFLRVSDDKDDKEHVLYPYILIVDIFVQVSNSFGRKHRRDASRNATHRSIWSFGSSPRVDRSILYSYPIMQPYLHSAPRTLLHDARAIVTIIIHDVMLILFEVRVFD